MTESVRQAIEQSSAAVDLRVDHVTICGRSLALLEQAFSGIGMRTDYGGTHPDSSTQMALLGFEDGSYVELIAPAEPAVHTKGRVKWSAMMAADAGPCAWAARV